MPELKVEVEYTYPPLIDESSEGLYVRRGAEGYNSARNLARNLSKKNRGMTVTILVNGIPVAEYLDGAYREI